jgi:hypothetical protein
MAEQKKEEVVAETLVVEQLPQISQREVTTEDNKQYHLVTKEEALTEILILVRALKKSLA